MKPRRFSGIGIALLVCLGGLLCPLHAAEQLVVAVVPDPNSFHATLRLFSREPSGSWKADAEAWPALIGKAGLAWGLGLHPQQDGLQKRERDKRAPEGRFRIGTIYGASPQLPLGAAAWPYVQVTNQDAWVDDPTLPDYNHFVRVTPGQEPAWFNQERMKPDDPAYAWRVLIEHNYPHAIPGAGSAIFFHIRRGEAVPTAGCTTMPRERLEQLIRWLRLEAHPEYVLLTQADYRRLWKSWDMPRPELMGITP